MDEEWNDSVRAVVESWLITEGSGESPILGSNPSAPTRKENNMMIQN